MSEQRFEPEVLALLDEIARSPDATMLRIPRERLLRFVGQPEEMISPRGSWLTKAEKHLVTAYREQAARVLLEACVLRLKEDPLIFSAMMLERGTLPKRARSLVRRLQKQSASLGALNALASGKTVPVSTLAVASLRLAPSELATNLLALAHQQESHVIASMRVLKRSLGQLNTIGQRAQAWENLARAHTVRGEFRAAFECDFTASHLDQSKLRLLANCFTTAIQGGSEAHAIESARRMEAQGTASRWSEIASALKLARSEGFWSPSIGARKLISGIRGRITESTGAICDAFS